MMTFSEYLRQARKKAGYTQETIAAELGIERTNYIPYETGKALPSIYTIPKLAKALGVTIQDIFDWMAGELGEDL